MSAIDTFCRAMRRHEKRAKRMGARYALRDIEKARARIGTAALILDPSRRLRDPAAWIRWNGDGEPFDYDSPTGAHLLGLAALTVGRYLAATKKEPNPSREPALR